MAEATPGIVSSGENTWNGGSDYRGYSIGTPSSRESRGMAEATPGTTNGGELMEWQRRIQAQ